MPFVFSGQRQDERARPLPGADGHLDRNMRLALLPGGAA